MNPLLTCVALCWQGPAAARRNAARTQQEESGHQSGNRSATDEPNSPHQSVSCHKSSEDAGRMRNYLETLLQKEPNVKYKKKKREERNCREQGPTFGDFFFFPDWRFNVHLKRTFHCSCVCSLLDTFWICKIDIRPNFLLPPLRLCLHVCMCFLLVGNPSLPLFHPWRRRSSHRW